MRCARPRGCGTHVHVAVDDDDAKLPQYRAVMDKAGADGDMLETGPRKGLCGTGRTTWPSAARASTRSWPAFGDDHVPRTPGWDLALIRAIDATWAARGSRTRGTVPGRTSPRRSSSAATSCRRSAGCASRHWSTGTSITSGPISAGARDACGTAGHRRRSPQLRGPRRADATASDNGRSLEADRDAYWHWRGKPDGRTTSRRSSPSGKLRVSGVTGVTALQPA